MENRWRRFDTVQPWPVGFVAIGDSVCSFNPLYGQGMTMSAQAALALSRSEATELDADLGNCGWAATLTSARRAAGEGRDGEFVRPQGCRRLGAPVARWLVRRSQRATDQWAATSGQQRRKHQTQRGANNMVGMGGYGPLR